jgi:hypothetical protein
LGPRNYFETALKVFGALVEFFDLGSQGRDVAAHLLKLPEQDLELLAAFLLAGFGVGRRVRLATTTVRLPCLLASSRSPSSVPG